jgi:hypothetical protein
MNFVSLLGKQWLSDYLSASSNPWRELAVFVFKGEYVE